VQADLDRESPCHRIGLGRDFAHATSCGDFWIVGEAHRNTRITWCCAEYLSRYIEYRVTSAPPGHSNNTLRALRVCSLQRLLGLVVVCARGPALLEQGVLSLEMIARLCQLTLRGNEVGL